MSARPARLTTWATPALPDISGLPAALPWYEVDRRQGVQSFPGDPAQALLDLWPVFRRAGAAQGAWSGDEPPIAVLTHCWRAFKKRLGPGRNGVVGQGGVPELRLDGDERGWFIQTDFSLEGGLPQDLTLYWADLRHLPRLRARSRGLWDFASDGLALLLPLGIDTFERSLEWFDMCVADDVYGAQEARIAVRADGGCEAAEQDAWERGRYAAAGEELRQLEEDAPRVIGGLRARLSRKDLARRFERRIRRAAVGPQWLEWGRHVLTAVRDLGPLWKLMDTERPELAAFEGEFYGAMFSLMWGSPRFMETCEQGFNDAMNSGGVMMPYVTDKLRGSRPGALERLRAKARQREAGLRALSEALWSFDKLAEQACGVIDDPQ